MSVLPPSFRRDSRDGVSAPSSYSVNDISHLTNQCRNISVNDNNSMSNSNQATAKKYAIPNHKPTDTNRSIRLYSNAPMDFRFDIHICVPNYLIVEVTRSIGPYRRHHVFKVDVELVPRQHEQQQLQPHLPEPSATSDESPQLKSQHWSVYKRYSDFTALHTSLRSDPANEAITRLEFPAKTGMFHIPDHQFLTHRAAGLGTWLRDVHALLTQHNTCPTTQSASLMRFESFLAEGMDRLPKHTLCSLIVPKEQPSHSIVHHAVSDLLPASCAGIEEPRCSSASSSSASSSRSSSAGSRSRSGIHRANSEGVSRYSRTNYFEHSHRMVQERKDDERRSQDTNNHNSNSEGNSSDSESSNSGANELLCRLEDFQLLSVIGKGSFGKVMLARDVRDEENYASSLNNHPTSRSPNNSRSDLYAIKVLNKAEMVRRKQVRRVRLERTCLEMVNSPFIVRLRGAFQTADHLFLVQDYCAGGELYYRLETKRTLSESTARMYIAECTLALQHLHSIGIVYRDMKPENIMLDCEGHVRLVDFGLAKTGIKSSIQGAKSFVGTTEYLSPEMIGRKGHGFAVDWWALGMVLYEMLSGLPPWYSEDKKVMVRGILKAPLEFKPYISANARDLLRGLLRRNPAQRTGSGMTKSGGTGEGAHEIKNHAFFRNVNWITAEARGLVAPFVPPLSHSTDTRHFDKCFTGLPVTVTEPGEPKYNTVSSSTVVAAPAVAAAPPSTTNTSTLARMGKSKVQQTIPSCNNNNSTVPTAFSSCSLTLDGGEVASATTSASTKMHSSSSGIGMVAAAASNAVAKVFAPLRSAARHSSFTTLHSHNHNRASSVCVGEGKKKQKPGGSEPAMTRPTTSPPLGPESNSEIPKLKDMTPSSSASSLSVASHTTASSTHAPAAVGLSASNFKALAKSTVGSVGNNINTAHRERDSMFDGFSFDDDL